MIIKRQTFSIAILLFLTVSAHSQTGAPSTPATEPATSNSTVTPITAKGFESTPIRQSRTGRVIVFKVNKPQDLPRVGRLVLLRKDGNPILALRVLLSDPGKNEFTARKVRRYDRYEGLLPDQTFETVEKLNDTLSNNVSDGTAVLASGAGTVPTEGAAPSVPDSGIPGEENPIADQPNQDPSNDGVGATEETGPPDDDEKILPFDDDLDKTTSPGEVGSEKAVYYEDEVIDEVPHFNPHSSGFDVHVGYFLNSSNFVLSPVPAGAAGLSYQTLLGRKWFAHGQDPQDRLLMEFGTGFYRLMNHSENNDHYTIVPVRGEFRYALDLSQKWTLNAYFGFQYNFLMQSMRAIRSVADDISGAQIVGGLGLTILLGPHWYFRTDAGWDRATVGIMIQW